MMDLLDALHYMFEEDMVPVSGEQQEARENMRKNLYMQIYGSSAYTWIAGQGGARAGGNRVSDFTPTTADSSDETSTELTHKPYEPPTPFDPDAAKPFGELLDEPLG